MSCVATGWTRPLGEEPALQISHRSPATARAAASAICDRQEFAMHTKSTLGRGGSGMVRYGEAPAVDS